MITSWWYDQLRSAKRNDFDLTSGKIISKDFFQNFWLLSIIFCHFWSRWPCLVKMITSRWYDQRDQQKGLTLIWPHQQPDAPSHRIHPLCTPSWQGQFRACSMKYKWKRNQSNTLQSSWWNTWKFSELIYIYIDNAENTAEWISMICILYLIYSAMAIMAPCGAYKDALGCGYAPTYDKCCNALGWVALILL